MMLRAGAIMLQYHGDTVLRCYIAIGFNMLLGQQQAENRKRKLGLSSLELWLPSIGDSKRDPVWVYSLKSFIVVTLLGGMAGTLLGTVGPKWVNSYPPVARGCNDISPVGGLQTDNL